MFKIHAPRKFKINTPYTIMHSIILLPYQLSLIFLSVNFYMRILALLQSYFITVLSFVNEEYMV